MISVAAIGRLGRDPELRTTPAGNEVVNFTLACDTGKDQTTWLRCACWGRVAGRAAQVLKKGTRVAVSGTLRERQYTDRNGEQRTSLDMTVTDFALLGERRPQQDDPAVDDVPF